MVNGRAVRTPQTELVPGDRLAVVPAATPVTLQRVGSQRFEIRFEDESLLIVEKPPGLLTVPTQRNESANLLTLLERYLRPQGLLPECVHRLDRGVSGLLVFAKRAEIAERLRDQFADRKPDRMYLAFARGKVLSKEGTIRSFLATDEHLNRYSTSDESKGQLAITHYRVLRTWGDLASQIELRLETGRRNQIRVHLAEAGHPLWGDTRYGRSLPPHRYWPYQRVALHAARLGFDHPLTGSRLVFESRMPREFHEFVQKLDAHR
jgi:23S rRNA pseudouridine1911/1915/1917 synthase